jgi:hypothetical protein
MGATVGIRLNIGNGSIAIPIEGNRKIVFHSSAESLRIPGSIEVIHADDFWFCFNLREVIAGLQREIKGFRGCRKLECFEVSRSVEVVRRSAFTTDEDESDRCAGERRARRAIFLTVGGESWLRRRRRGCQIFITGKSGCKRAEKEENRPVALSEIISYLSATCGGNVYDKSVVEITASSG